MSIVRGLPIIALQQLERTARFERTITLVNNYNYFAIITGAIQFRLKLTIRKLTIAIF